MRCVTLALPILLLLGFASGCAFDRNWRSLSRATVEENPQTDLLAGRWEGKWISEQSGHQGKLRAIMRRKEDSSYRADFDAMFFAILRAGYGINLNVKPQGHSKVEFEGEEDLGSLAGGVYKYKGETDGQTFSATYTCSIDRGRFEMKRPATRSH